MQTQTQAALPVEILLVEDSTTDADLTIRALKNGRFANGIHHVKDGVEALAFLRREGEFRAAPTPDLILLDLNMPRMDGRELLRELRGDTALSELAVVALTTSDEEAAMLESHGLHANACIVKPVDLRKFLDVVSGIDDFWSQVVKPPPDGPSAGSAQGPP
jgi:CheY-like chemotaxis protein